MPFYFYLLRSRWHLYNSKSLHMFGTNTRAKQFFFMKISILCRQSKIVIEDEVEAAAGEIK